MKSNEEEKEENDNDNGKETKPKKRKFSKKNKKSKRKSSSKLVEEKPEGAIACDETNNSIDQKEEEQVNEKEIDNDRNTLPRTRRSRSTSGRRSFKDLFHRSSKPRLKKERSQSTGGIEYTEGEVSSINLDSNTYQGGQPFNNADYTKFDPILQPRDRLKYMTVRDAMQEKNTRKSPIRGNFPFEVEERTSSRGSLSSSLPALAGLESKNSISDFADGTMRKSHLSKSEDFNRDSTENSDDTNKKENVQNHHKCEENEDKSIDDMCEPQYRRLDISNIAMNKIEDRPVGRIASYPSAIYARPHSTSPCRNSIGKTRDPSPMSVSRGELNDTEKQRRESFSKFLKLSNTLPQYSSSSLSRLKKGDSVEESSHTLDSIKEKSPVTEKQTVDKENDHKLRLPDLPLMGTAEKLELGNKTIIDAKDSDSEFKVLSDIAKEVSEQYDICQTINPNISENVIDKSEKNDSVEQIKVRKRLSRSEYKSPRRFSGRVSSGGRKSKTKDDKNELEDDLDKPETTKDKSPFAKSEDKNEQALVVVQGEVKHNIPEPKVTSKSETLPSRTKRQLFSSSRGKSNKGTVAKPLMNAIGTQSENVQDLGKTDNVVSKSIQTSFESLKFDGKDNDKRYKGVQSNLQDVVETEQHDISEISDVDKENSFFQAIDKTKCKSPRNSSNASDRTAEIQDLDDITEFKTPEGTPPTQKRVILPPLSDLKIIDAEVQRSNIESVSGECSSATAVEAEITDEPITDEPISDEPTPTSVESDTSKKERKGNGKSKKVSLLGIISLKRRLVRQRSQRDKRRPGKTPGSKEKKSDSEKSNQQTVDEEHSSIVDESKDDSDIKTQVFIENETNLNLSKLALLQETDIIDDIVEISDDPLPKKHITFDNDEPVLSDDPIEDEVIQRPRKGLATRRESRILEKRRKVISCCKQFVAFLFSHIGLCSLVVAYSILGGIIFQALEAPFEKKTRLRITDQRVSAITKILQLAQELQLSKQSRENFTHEVNNLLMVFQTEVYTATDLYGWNNKEDVSDSELQWSFASSLLFAITVMTTIGYGHVAPKTNYGRIVTIGYAVLGIPLTLLCLTNIGDLMATGFRMLYAKVCCGFCCVLFSPKKRRLPDPEKGINTEEEVVIQGQEKSPEVINVPTSLCILVMTAYILLGTLLFSIWEGWDVITGTYFSFITLSTIGFGDVVPGTATKQWANEQKLVLCAMYLVFGLSLIAMCFNLVQEDVKAKCRWLGAKIGIIDHSKT